MADDESALRELLTRTAVRFEPIDGTAVRAAADHGKKDGRVRRVLLPVAAALSVAGIAATASLVAHHPSAGPAGTVAPTQTAPKPSGGRHTTAHTFQVRLVLPGTSFPANGSPIHAYVLAINHTGRPVVIYNACNGWLQASLTGEHVTFTMENGLVGCASETIARGTTRIPVSISTTFTQCQQGKLPGTPDDPHCQGTHDDRLPNLPPGSYQAVVGTQSTSIPPILSEPQPITLAAVR